MYDKNGKLQKEDAAILDICHQFYSDLYAHKQAGFNSPYAFIPPAQDIENTLDQSEIDRLDEDISLDELSETLKGMEKGKAPGLDGLTVEFYEKFWNEVGPLVFRSLVYSKECHRLSTEQRRGVVKLLPKKDKNPIFVRNLRPITLLNVDVKILTRLLANRLKEVLDKLIHNDQQAFVKGRYLRHNILEMYSMATKALEDDEEFLVMSLDIEKAFDSVNWDFLYNLLHTWQFPPSFIGWIQLMHTQKELRVYNNRFSSQPIQVHRGLAQGCALSPLLFIFCIEALARVVRQNNIIEGMQFDKSEKKIGLVADDAVLVAKATHEVLQEVENVLSEFERVSGLKINYEKSIICSIGKTPINLAMYSRKPFKWLKRGSNMKYLGVTLSQDEQGQFIDVNNFQNIGFQIGAAIKSLRFQHRSLLGRILIIKSMLASLFVYRFSLLPTPSEGTLKEIERHYYAFLWNNYKPRVARKTMTMELSQGGFNMIDVFLQEKSLKFKWIQRLLDPAGNFLWKSHVSSCFSIDISVMLQMNLRHRGWRKLLKPNAVLPKFWQDSFHAWFATTFVNPRDLQPDFSDLLQKHVWDCAVTKRLNLTCLKALQDMNIVMVQDFIAKKGQFPQNVHIACLRRTMPIIWQQVDLNSVPSTPSLHFGISVQKWSVKAIYKKLNEMAHRKYSPTAKALWSNTMQQEDVSELWIKSCKLIPYVKDPKLRSFHLTFINRGHCYNNARSYYLPISDECSFCKEKRETVEHLYWSCPVVKPALNKLKDFFQQELQLPAEAFTRENFLFSTFAVIPVVIISILFKRFVFMQRIARQQCIIRTVDLLFEVFVQQVFKYIVDLSAARGVATRALHKQWGPLLDDAV